MKENQRKWKARQREDKTKTGRLRNFQEATMFGPLFICISCHGKMFRNGVKIFTDSLQQEIEKEIPIKDCIADLGVITKVVMEHKKSAISTQQRNDMEAGTRFLCDTCHRYLKSGKLPPSSAMNSLQLSDTDEDLKNQNLQLTELEGALIAPNIVFQKIFQLPRSRWTGLKDKIINVPISSESINNTLAQLPRTPGQAGLIPIELKRKKDMKNNHMKQLINPNKIFNFLQKLKDAGSPYHQDIKSPEAFKALCSERDKYGYKAIYSDSEDDDEEMDQMNDDLKENTDKELVNQDADKAKDEEEEYHLKKYQFQYDESLCMMDKYPEITIAPGEGQKLKSIHGDKHWDIKAFPHLHNADGSNGKDQERKVRLTDQRYFIQRIINKEKRFAASAAYLYSAIAYIEEKRILQNMSLVGSRGKAVKGKTGKISYELEDEYRVLEGIPNSPKYWQKLKYEIHAKIDNLGPFHLFFTLSCADQRWDPTFATILSEKGYSIMFIKTDVDGLPKTLVEVRTAAGDWKPLKEFLEDDIADSKHELIRGNVVMATRYFHHRVKSFISKIVMSKSNPMNVKYYTYKVEFQGRGKIFIFFFRILLW